MTLPPRPPSPPSGPPFGTYFSRRKLTTPEPPRPAATWILVYQHQDKVNKDEHQAQAVVHFLIWALLSGSDSAHTLGYATLPDALRQGKLP